MTTTYLPCVQSLKHTTLAMIFIFLSSLPLLAFAHGDEDHSDEAKAPLSATIVSGARLELSSPDVEILGVLQDGKLTLYADRYTSNEPIRNAQIVLESNGKKITAQPNQDNTYTLIADWLTQPGKYEVVLSIQADGLEDLLIGTLIIPAPAIEATGRSWLIYVKWTAFSLAALLVLAILRKQIRRYKGVVTPVILALISATLLSSHSTPGFAHGDEDHTEKPKTASATPLAGSIVIATPASPVRLPDGSIFVPKPVQRVLGIRTLLGETHDIALTINVNGHVITNPNFSGYVQSSQSGRIAAPESNFPTLGEKVSKGQILAYIEPAASSIDKGNQESQLAEISSKLTLAENRVKRLALLVGSMPQKEIDAAQAEAISLKARKTAIAASFQREALRSPISGVISKANVAAGQVVESKEILFEIIEPSKLRVEANIYDAAIAGQISGATAITSNNQPIKLTFIGQSYQLRDQSLPIQFSVNQPAPILSVDQPLKVLIQTKQTLHGISIPQSSVMKNNNGDTIVWIHAAAERFIPKKVKIQPLDDQTTAVVDGLHDGDRIVTQGATLLNQVR